mgnify:CR=1 FL=1
MPASIAIKNIAKNEGHILSQELDVVLRPKPHSQLVDLTDFYSKTARGINSTPDL